jgi:hypothetical protein
MQRIVVPKFTLNEFPRSTLHRSRIYSTDAKRGQILEVEADLCRQSPRCHIVRATEGRQVVVQGIFVENIDARQP